MSLRRADFDRQIVALYESLYDLVYLRTHPLTEILIPDPAIDGKEKAWQLHEMLLEVLKELDPGPTAPAFSRGWRRHRLMVLRYVDGIVNPDLVASEIGVSRRQYYREHNAALKAIAAILWERCVGHPPALPQVAEAAEGKSPPSHLELLRLEAARLARAERYAHADEILRGVVSLLQPRLEQRELDVEWALPAGLPDISTEKGLLRQMLLAMLGYLVERTRRATIHLAARVEAPAVTVTITVEPPEAVQPTEDADAEERLTAFREMATLGNARILPSRCGRSMTGFVVRLCTASEPTVLVVDDNQDVLELFQRYLVHHHYRIVTARTVDEAQDLADRLQPDVITLDLMMPEQDGWDLLQTLANGPATRHIPVIICTVLKQKELALALGAAAFLEKPVSEQDLLSTVEALMGK